MIKYSFKKYKQKLNCHLFFNVECYFVSLIAIEFQLHLIFLMKCFQRKFEILSVIMILELS